MKNQIYKNLKILIGATIFIFGMTCGLFWFYSLELPPMAEVQSYQVNSGSEVYDANGRLIHIFAVENRKLTSYNNLPPHLINSLIVIEDTNFYKHWGIDLYGLFRAIVVDVITWDFAQGGSTITQQLARNMFLNLDKQLPRKIKEAMLAVLIEKNFTKEEILEIYFNKIYFGSGIYGIETAAYRYFGKEAKDLSIGEAALLVGMIQRPNYYSPLKNPEKSVQRRNFVLNRLFDQGYISDVQYETALNEKIDLNLHKFVTNLNTNYFIDYIRIKLERKYGTETIFNGGLKIYTTMDSELQLYADSMMNDHLRTMEQNRNYKDKYDDYPKTVSNVKSNYLQGGVYAIEPQTGYVRIMIGGRNFRHSKFNRMTQAKRQAGSSFKPILYTAALEKGYTPSTIINDAPVTFLKDGQIYWEPKNYEKSFYGYVTIRNALKKSMNVSAAKLIYDVGPQNVVNIAKNFGMTTNIPPYMSISVGSCEVIPYELISSFCILANNGERVTPIYFTKITDHKGKVLEENKPEKVRVLDPKIAWLMTNLLKTVVDHGTAFPIRAWGFNNPCAGKTGTTDDYRDAWFIGYTPKLVLGVWAGFDNNQEMGSGMTGATATLPFWIPIMKKATFNQLKAGEDVDADFERPEGIIEMNVSQTTGFAKGGNLIKEYFIKGTEPPLRSDSLRYNFLPSKLRPGKDRYLTVKEVKGN